MKKYEYLMNQSELCTRIAQLFVKLNDSYLVEFYRHAAEGYKSKALKLSTREA